MAGRSCASPETLFHPQGGGQKADRGTIGGRAVTHVAHADGGEVNHYLDSTDGLSVGDAVEIAVDAEWRQLNARWHTAGHLIAAVVEKLFPTLQGVAGHHWPGEGRVEFAPGDVPAAEEVAASEAARRARGGGAGRPAGARGRRSVQPAGKWSWATRGRSAAAARTCRASADSR